MSSPTLGPRQPAEGLQACCPWRTGGCVCWATAALPGLGSRRLTERRETALGANSQDQVQAQLVALAPGPSSAEIKAEGLADGAWRGGGPAAHQLGDLEQAGLFLMGLDWILLKCQVPGVPGTDCEGQSSRICGCASSHEKLLVPRPRPASHGDPLLSGSVLCVLSTSLLSTFEGSQARHSLRIQQMAALLELDACQGRPYRGLSRW